ncbi:MAG: DNA primase [Clostridiales Family XIII bacterium]|nr:DNA primase [Clostridiales Family XIII bacterium]
MAAISNIAEEIKARADIVEVIGRTVSLKRKGGLWEGRCPFHSEKTPSFKVYEASQHYHCYGCGESGDVITFYMKHFNLDFIEAAERLAGEYGIEWTPGSTGGGGQQSSIFHEINRAAGKYYHDALRSEGNPGFSYLLERGVDQKTMMRFGLGYADGKDSDLCLHLKGQGFDLDKAAEIGLVVKDGNRYKDRYFRRVMFPIINTRGKVIGFGARTLDPEGIPKYLNSSESKVFLKKNNLYGINLTKDAIVKERCAIFVEGYMDVISLYQHGVHNVTASLGTALTAAQARMVKRYASEVVLAYDADKAGQDAALRGLEVLRDAGLTVRVLTVSDGKDPDEYIRRHGRNTFYAAAQSATPATEYRLARIRERFDLEAKEGAVSFLNEAADVLRGLCPVEADYYIRHLEEETGIAAGAIRMQVDRASELTQHPGRVNRVDHFGTPPPGAEPATQGGRAGTAHTSGRDGGQAVDLAALMLQRNLIRLLVHDSRLLSRMSGRGRAFSDESLLRIYAAIAQMEREAESGAAGDSAGGANAEQLMETLEDRDRNVLADILDKVLVEEDSERQFLDCIARIDLAELSAHRRNIDIMLPVTTDEDERHRLLEELDKVNKQIYAIKSERGIG